MNKIPYALLCPSLAKIHQVPLCGGILADEIEG